MKGYTIRESIDRLEKRGGGSGGGSSASDISFNKTGTSLNATNVQAAIAEVDANVSANVADIEQLQLDIVPLEAAHVYPENGQTVVIGTWGDRKIKRKCFSGEALLTGTGNYLLEVGATLLRVIGSVVSSEALAVPYGSYEQNFGFTTYFVPNTGYLDMRGQANVAGKPFIIFVDYIEPAPEPSEE